MNWTFNQDAMITDEALAALDQARAEIAKAAPADMLDQAERIVFRGHVMMVENIAWVFDPDGGWRTVGHKHCPHCSPDGGLCRHKLAAWLAKHLAAADPRADEPPAAFRLDDGPVSTGGSYLGGIGPGYRGGRRSGGSSRRRSTCTDCSKCGFFRHGSCNNPNKKAGRGR